MDNFRKISILGLILSLGLVACGDDDDVADTGRDTATPDTDTPDTDTPDMGRPDTPIPDRGTDAFNFRVDPASSYTRVDRMGMPAVSTAFLGDRKAEYNQDSPADDVSEEEVPGIGPLPKYAPTIATALGTYLRGDGTDGNGITMQLATLDLTSCENTAADIPLNAFPCALQTVGGADGPTVLDLVIPDTLSLDTSAATRAYPNGRAPADQAMDITLAVVLLNLEVHSPLTFTDLNGDAEGTPSLNPAANDVAFNAAFPYLADAQ